MFIENAYKGGDETKADRDYIESIFGNNGYEIGDFMYYFADISAGPV